MSKRLLFTSNAAQQKGSKAKKEIQKLQYTSNTKRWYQKTATATFLNSTHKKLFFYEKKLFCLIFTTKVSYEITKNKEYNTEKEKALQIVKHYCKNTYLLSMVFRINPKVQHYCTLKLMGRKLEIQCSVEIAFLGVTNWDLEREKSIRKIQEIVFFCIKHVHEFGFSHL